MVESSKIKKLNEKYYKEMEKFNNGWLNYSEKLIITVLKIKKLENV